MQKRADVIPGKKKTRLESLVKPIRYDLCPGERRLPLRRVHHPVPVCLADHEADLAELELGALLFDVGPTDLGGKRRNSRLKQ